jgi:hypothetical protein
MNKLAAVLLLFPLLIACQSDPVKTELSPKQKALYNSWRITQCYYSERPIGVYLVNRNDTMQEEFIKSSGMVVEFDVNWRNDSMYHLRFKRVTENPQQISLPADIENLVKSCWMQEVTDTTYVEAALSNLVATKSDTIYTLYRRPKSN